MAATTTAGAGAGGSMRGSLRDLLLIAAMAVYIFDS